MAERPSTRGRSEAAVIYLAMPQEQERRIEGRAQIDGNWLHVWPSDPDAPAASYPFTQVHAVEWTPSA